VSDVLASTMTHVDDIAKIVVDYVLDVPKERLTSLVWPTFDLRCFAPYEAKKALGNLKRALLMFVWRFDVPGEYETYTAPEVELIA
jgi:hypothetical protein